eukprot:GEMP01061625.1.p1 GENE.GEMP01061625.1~~GEMP01061625.1.p1  ORF type:complete len:241 (+),score=56.78 GEMP01061625.1:28-723(+)
MKPVKKKKKLFKSENAKAAAPAKKKKRQARGSEHKPVTDGDADKGLGTTDAPRMRKVESTYGPPVGVSSMVNDDWQTCLESWQAMADIMAPFKSKRIWQPFFYDGECAKHLCQLGFSDVIHTRDDFFQLVKDDAFVQTIDIIWDNPPYTSPETKQKVLQALADSKKPFCVLLPMAVLHAQFVRDMLDMSKVQTVIPRKVFVKKKNQSKVPFKYLIWLCYDLNLPKDLYFIS